MHHRQLFSSQMRGHWWTSEAFLSEDEESQEGWERARASTVLDCGLEFTAAGSSHTQLPFESKDVGCSPVRGLSATPAVSFLAAGMGQDGVRALGPAIGMALKWAHLCGARPGQSSIPRQLHPLCQVLYPDPMKCSPQPQPPQGTTVPYMNHL